MHTLTLAHLALSQYLVHSQSPKGQWFAFLVVDQEHLRVQDHAVAPGESLGDVVLKVGHLEAEGEGVREGVRPQKEHRTPTCASRANVQNRPRPRQPPRQEESAMFRDLCPDPGRGQPMLRSFSIGCRGEFAGKRKKLRVKMRVGGRQTWNGGREGGQAEICAGERTSWKKDGREEMNPLRRSNEM